MRFFVVVFAFLLISLQSAARLVGQGAVARTVSITCRCDDDGKAFAELLAKKFATAAFSVVSAQKQAVPVEIRIVISSHQSSRFGTQLKSTSGDSAEVPSVMKSALDNREPVRSTISLECTFPGGKLVEEVRRCDRVGLISIVDEVAADLASALQMEPTKAEDAA